jgi:hypothetical protein
MTAVLVVLVVPLLGMAVVLLVVRWARRWQRRRVIAPRLARLQNGLL